MKIALGLFHDHAAGTALICSKNVMDGQDPKQAIILHFGLGGEEMLQSLILIKSESDIEIEDLI